MGLRSAASPLFLQRIEQVTRGLRISSEDCGTALRMELPPFPEPVRSPVFCEAEAGPCAACYQGDPCGPRLLPGDELGGLTIKAFQVALRAYKDRLERVTSGAFEVRWPSFHLGKPSGKALLRAVDLPDGLVYLADLLEARTPRPEAILSESEGRISLGPPRNKKHVVQVVGAFEYEGRSIPTEQTYLIAEESSLRVTEGDLVTYGDALSEGQPSPHAILRILGERALARWMLGEIRDLFGAVDVRWADRHGALLLWRMLRRVRICEAGDTALKPGMLVDRHEFVRINEVTLQERGTPAIAEQVLRGVSEL